MKSTAMLLILAVVLLCPALSNGQTSLLEHARKEGEVVLYSTITVGAFNELSKALKETYPFLNVRHIRLGPAQQLARIMQEQRAGQFLSDIVYNNLLHLIYMKDHGMHVSCAAIRNEKSYPVLSVLALNSRCSRGRWLCYG